MNAPRVFSKPNGLRRRSSPFYSVRCSVDVGESLLGPGCKSASMIMSPCYVQVALLSLKVKQKSRSTGPSAIIKGRDRGGQKVAYRERGQWGERCGGGIPSLIHIREKQREMSR